MHLVNPHHNPTDVLDAESPLSTIISPLEMLTIENKCQKIDSEISNMTMSVIAIGRYLTEITSEIRLSCETSGIAFGPIYETFLQTRFNRKANWAYRHMQIFSKFKEEDPLLGQLAINNLTKLCKLNDAQIETVRSHIVSSGQKLNRDQMDKLIDSIAPREIVTIENDTLDEELAEITQKQVQLEKNLRNIQDERDRLKNELDSKTQINSELISRLQQEQDATKNVAAALGRERDELSALQKKIEEDKKQASKKPSSSLLVETDKIPDGYASIEDAIADADARFQAKMKELKDIEDNIAREKSILLESETAQNALEELHELYSSLQIKQLEVLNVSKSSDLKKNKSLLEKLSTIAIDLGSTLKHHTV